MAEIRTKAIELEKSQLQSNMLVDRMNELVDKLFDDEKNGISCQKLTTQNILEELEKIYAEPDIT